MAKPNESESMKGMHEKPAQVRLPKAEKLPKSSYDDEKEMTRDPGDEKSDYTEHSATHSIVLEGSAAMKARKDGSFQPHMLEPKEHSGGMYGKTMTPGSAHEKLFGKK